MPYFIDRNLERDDQTKDGFQISGASQVADPSGNPNQPQGANKGLNTGSGFQNLDKYLTTNNAQAAGQRLSGNVASEVGKAQETMTNAANRYQSQLNDLNKVATNDEIKGAIAAPTINEGQVKGYLNQQYKAPEAIGSDYWGQQQKAATKAGLLGTESGRFTLLDSYFGRPNYTYGQKSLDQLLAQKGGAGQAARGLQEQSADIANQGNLKMQDLASQEKQKQSQIEESRKLASGELSGAIGSLKTGVQQRVDQFAGGNNLDVIRQDLKDGSVSPETLKFLGLSGGENIYDLDLSKYLKEGSAANAAGLSSPEEMARYRALSGLAGQSDDLFNQPAEAGVKSSFDAGALKKDADLRSKQVDFERKKDPAISRLVTDFMSTINYNKAHGSAPQMGASSPLQNLPKYPAPAELMSALQQQVNMIRKRAGGPSSAEKPFTDMMAKLDKEVKRFDSKFTKKLSVSDGREGPSQSRSVRG